MGRSIITRLAAAVISVAIGLVALATAAQARTNYALIVGVTKYPHLPENTWLVGPDNDAELVSEYLIDNAGFNAENVIVLADGVDGAQSPTLDAIRGAMKDLAQRIRDDGDPNSFVYLHFSGHGSQMPAIGEDSENDGKDEVFLPADTKKWDSDLNGFPNAYVDDDIGADITALRAAGAFVWAVFDACHSSSATRAAPGEGIEVSRRLDPTALGAPEDAVVTATRSLGETATRENPVEGTSNSQLGGLVAFFAAQTVETTPEMPLPRDAEEQRRYGLFTYTLFENIAKFPNASYRQLGQSILQAYSGMNRRAPTPLFEGELDAVVFGDEQTQVTTQWRIKVDGTRVKIDAGRMHRLTKGTKLALLENAADTVDQAIGYLEVKSAKNLKSTLRPVAHNDLDAPDPAQLKRGVWVRPVEYAVDFVLTVARAGGGAEADAINAAIDRLAADDQQLFRIKAVDAGANADIALTVASEADIHERMDETARQALLTATGQIRPSLSTDTRLWFLPTSGEASLLPGRRPVSMPLDGDVSNIDGHLAGRLTKIFRATNLARMSAASDFKGKVDVNFLIKRDGSGEFEPIEAGTVPFVSEADEIHLEIANNSSRAIDLNILHIATDYAISALDPIRIERRGEEELGLFEVTSETLGIERLVAVVTEAAPGTDVQDLRFLAQGGVRSVEDTRGVGDDAGFVGMLNAMGRQAKTRGASSLSAKKGTRGAVMIFPIETIERN